VRSTPAGRLRRLRRRALGPIGSQDAAAAAGKEREIKKTVGLPPSPPGT